MNCNLNSDEALLFFFFFFKKLGKQFNYRESVITLRDEICIFILHTYFVNKSRKSNYNYWNDRLLHILLRIESFLERIPRIRIYTRGIRVIFARQYGCIVDTTELRYLVCVSKKFQGLINLLKGGWSRLLLFHVNIVATAI